MLKVVNISHHRDQIIINYILHPFSFLCMYIKKWNSSWENMTKSNSWQHMGSLKWIFSCINQNLKFLTTKVTHAVRHNKGKNIHKSMHIFSLTKSSICETKIYACSQVWKHLSVLLQLLPSKVSAAQLPCSLPIWQDLPAEMRIDTQL